MVGNDGVMVCFLASRAARRDMSSALLVEIEFSILTRFG